MRTLGIASVLIASLISAEAFAVRVHLFDVDGTLVHDSGVNEQGKKPAWWTYWVLDRVTSVNNGWNIDQVRRLMAGGQLPERIYLNKNEVDRWRDRFAARNERVGNLEAVDLDADPLRENFRPEIKPYRPRQIYAGYYRIEEAFSYALHRDSQNTPSPLITSYRTAVARTKRDPENFEWRGPAFPFFYSAIQRQSLEERIYFLTDRDHEEKSYLEWVNAMHADRFIPDPVRSVERPDARGEMKPDMIFPKAISSTAIDSRRFGPLSQFDSRKGAAIIDRAINISRSPLAKTSVIGPDFNDAKLGRRRLMHEFVYYENKPEYVRELIKIFKQNAAYMPDIKFVFFHAGPIESVEALLPYAPEPVAPELRRWFVVSPTGTGLRNLTKAELDDITGASGCEAELSPLKMKEKA